MALRAGAKSAIFHREHEGGVGRLGSRDCSRGKVVREGEDRVLRAKRERYLSRVVVRGDSLKPCAWGHYSLGILSILCRIISRASGHDGDTKVAPEHEPFGYLFYSIVIMLLCS